MNPKQGIAISFFDSPGYHRLSYFNSAEGTSNKIYAKPEERIRTKIKLPLWNRPGLKAAFGVYYNKEEFDVHTHYRAPVTTELELKRVKANLSVLKPFRGRHYVALRAEIDFSGDFTGILAQEAYRRLTMSAFWGFRKNSRTELGIGLVYRDGFFNQRVLPVLMYNHNFSDKWGLEMVLPQGVTLRLNHNESTIFNFESRIQTDRYLINANRIETFSESEQPFFLFDRMELRTGVNVKKNLMPMIWIEASAGIRQDLNLFTNDAVPQLSSTEPFSTYISVGIFIAPPRCN